MRRDEDKAMFMAVYALGVVLTIMLIDLFLL